MNDHSLSLIAYVAVCIISSAFLWSIFKKASPSQRRAIAFAAIGAVGVVLLALLLHALR